MKTTKATDKEIKATDKEIKATPLYKDYISALCAENKSIQKTTEKIELIKATGLTLPEFFMLLWSEGYKVPETWPLNTAGSPLSPLSSKTRAAVPEVNRLVSALAMRSKREADKTDKTDKTDSDVEGTGAQIAKFDKNACIAQLQALLTISFEVNEDVVIYDTAKKLVKLLIDRK